MRTSTVAPDRSRRVVRIALRLAVLAALTLQSGSLAAQEPVLDASPRCEDAFTAAESVARALDSSAPDPRVASLRAALLDLTIASCDGEQAWLAAAAEHPSVVEGDAQVALAARCADRAAASAGSAACGVGVMAVTPTLVELPSIKPRVKGAQKAEYYPIVGLSDDELFTQMQVNGAVGCPTHAVACVNIQPNIRPLVSSATGRCRVIGIQASISTQAFLPRWAGPEQVYPELVDWWRKVATRIGRHEAEHIRIANRHLARLRREIVGRSCSSLQAYVTRWSKGLTEAQDAYDAKELERPWPPYDGPGSEPAAVPGP